MTHQMRETGIPWFRAIPAEWDAVALGRLATPVKRTNISDAPLLSLYLGEGIVPYKADRIVHATSEDTSAYQLVLPGDFVLNNQQAWRGSVAISQLRGIISPAYIVCQVSRRLGRRFGGYLFASYAARFPYVISSRGVGDIQRNLSWQLLKAQEFPLPPTEEQRAIADYLDRETARIDTLIEEQKRLIELLRERRAAAIASALANLSDAMTRLKYVSTIQTGVTLSGEGDSADAEWPYLRVANVQVGYVDLGEIKTVRVPSERAVRSMLQRGDVLMTEGGDIDKLGRGALWRGDLPNMLHQNHIFAVRPNESLDSEFLVYWLDGPVARTYFRTTAKQTTNLAATNKWTVGNLPVALPPIEDQRRAIATLDEQTAVIGSLIEETERFIELARERRSALITAAVTGQIDVREAA